MREAASVSDRFEWASRPAGGALGASLRVLLAEDNTVNQLVTRQALRNLGHRVDVVANGIEARDAVLAIPYDIVLMDCEMPELDGYGASTAIRAAERPGCHVPIIAMTASAVDGDRQRCLAAGMDDYLAKPFRLDKLAEVLRAWSASAEGGPAVDGHAGQHPAAWTGAGEVAILDGNTVEQLRAVAAEAPGLMEELVGSFVGDLPARLAVMTSAVVRGDPRAAGAAAHALKGGAGNLGAMRLAKACDRLEQLARRGDLSAAGPALADILAEARPRRVGAQRASAISGAALRSSISRTRRGDAAALKGVR
jgi:CheY-like chemotaxis protein